MVRMCLLCIQVAPGQFRSEQLAAPFMKAFLLTLTAGETGSVSVFILFGTAFQKIKHRKP